VKADVDQVTALFAKKLNGAGVRAALPERKPGEDDRTYFKRVDDELKRRREAQNRSGVEKGK
jgi:hypothetical protein